MTPSIQTRSSSSASLDLLRRHSLPLEGPDDLDPLLERIADARVVMLGESTHGTSEFYTWRARLSQRLIQEHGFSFIAVEGDWPDCYRLNRFVKGYGQTGDHALDIAARFQRWPTWMWANWEVVALLDWIHRFNQNLPSAEQVGFFGLDVYSLHDSMMAILNFVKDKDPEALPTTEKALNCFAPHGLSGQDYARAVSLVRAHCEEEVIELLTELRRRAPFFDGDREEHFNALQNARVLKNAEAYYRTMLRPGPDSWNLRDHHMDQTLQDLLDFHGPDSRAIVWEHNTHIGDARYTDMSSAGMINLGQLARERFGDDDVVLVGFGTYRGSVIAASSWGAPMEEISLPTAIDESWEDLLHRALGEDCLLLLDEIEEFEEFNQPRNHRAVGVVYHPWRESFANYVPTILPGRYDALIYIDESHALHPLHLKTKRRLEPDTYPWGL